MIKNSQRMSRPVRSRCTMAMSGNRIPAMYSGNCGSGRGPRILGGRNVAVQANPGTGFSNSPVGSRPQCAPVPVWAGYVAQEWGVLGTPVFWLGRQPILDLMANTVGYEL